MTTRIAARVGEAVSIRVPGAHPASHVWEPTFDLGDLEFVGRRPEGGAEVFELRPTAPGTTSVVLALRRRGGDGSVESRRYEIDAAA